MTQAPLDLIDENPPRYDKAIAGLEAWVAVAPDFIERCTDIETLMLIRTGMQKADERLTEIRRRAEKCCSRLIAKGAAR